MTFAATTWNKTRKHQNEKTEQGSSRQQCDVSDHSYCLHHARRCHHKKSKMRWEIRVISHFSWRQSRALPSDLRPLGPVVALKNETLSSVPSPVCMARLYNLLNTVHLLIWILPIAKVVRTNQSLFIGDCPEQPGRVTYAWPSDY